MTNDPETQWLRKQHRSQSLWVGNLGVARLHLPAQCLSGDCHHLGGRHLEVPLRVTRLPSSLMQLLAGIRSSMAVGWRLPVGFSVVWLTTWWLTSSGRTSEKARDGVRAKRKSLISCSQKRHTIAILVYSRSKSLGPAQPQGEGGGHFRRTNQCTVVGN